MGVGLAVFYSSEQLNGKSGNECDAGGRGFHFVRWREGRSASIAGSPNSTPEGRCCIAGEGETLLVLPIEGLDARRLAEFATLCAPAAPRLIITARRALALGLAATTPVALQLTAGDDADTILALVADAKIDGDFDAKPAGFAAAAAIQLVKLSHGLPAVLAADVAAEDALAFEPQIITVEAEAVARFGDRGDSVACDCQRSVSAAQFRHAHPFRRFPRCDGRQFDRHHCRKARLR